MSADLPYVDEHAVEIDAPGDAVWAALEQYVSAALVDNPRHLLGAALGTEPRAGFEVAEREVGHRLALVGRHRFSRYQLTFTLDVGDGSTELRAITHAAFPGLHGRLYRLLVIGSGGHGVATRHILRSISRRALDLASR